MSDSPDRPSDLSRIFDEFPVRRQRGESPVPDEYCQRFPDLADQLRLHVRLYDARVVRAGSFLDPAAGLRSAQRTYRVPLDRNNIIGFRVARTILLGTP
jgi:formylglycine-generating enzyme required for sulfatase activity